MKITDISVRSFVIKDVKGVDPILVIMYDVSPGKGYLIVECFGECWSCYWGGMGEGYDVARFVAEAGMDYLGSKMQSAFDNRRHRIQYLRKVLGVVQEALKERRGVVNG